MAMKRAVTTVFIIMILSLFSACNLTFTEDWKASRDVVSSDGLIQLTVPESYADTDKLNELATIQVANEKDLKCTMAIAESKSLFEDTFTLNDCYDYVSSSMAGYLESAEISAAEPAAIGDYKNLQFSLSGTISKVRWKYLITLIETDTCYYQITSWTPQYLYYDAEATFKKIAESFTELQTNA